MDITKFYELRERLYNTAAAGCMTVSEDFRLKRAVEDFKPLAEANKAFAKLFALCEKLLAAEKPECVIADCIALCDALAVTQGAFADNSAAARAEGEYSGETVCPTIILGYIKTEKQTPAELKNESFKANSIEECEEREDEFYIFEHEPMFKYNVKIADFRDGKALICCSGTAVEDGFADKPKKVKFAFDEWVAVAEMSVNENFSDDVDDEQTAAPADGKQVGFIANGGANPEDLELSEKLAGFAFPEDLRKFLLEKNGAVPETAENHIILPAVKEKLGVRFLYGLTQISGTDASHFIPKELKDRRLFIPEQMVPVAVEKRGLCWISYSNLEKYKGVYAVDRMLKLKQSKRDSCIYKIADTFTEFLSKIVADE